MKHLILPLFFLFTLSTTAQETSFSALKKNEGAGYPLLSITENIKAKEYQVVTFQEKNDYYLVNFDIYDSLLVSKNTVSHSWKKAGNDKVTFLGSAIFQKKFYSYFSVITESKLTNELVMVENQDGKLEVKILDQYEIKSVSNTGAYKLSFSPSQKTMLVMKESVVEKGKNEDVKFVLFDEMMNKVYDVAMSFPVVSKPNPVNKALVDDKGDFFIIKKDREKTEYKFYLYAYNVELKGWNQKQISIPGKMISDIDACLNSSQEFIVSGFYNTLDVSSYEGYFYYRFDANMKYVSKVNKRFEVDFMANFIGKKAASKEDAVITGYYFENLVSAPGDNSFLIAEIEEFDNTGGIEKYGYGDILFLQLDKEGTIKNSGSVKNKQQTQSDGGEWSSFNYAACKDTLHLFHNEVNPSDSKSKFTDATFAGTYQTRIIKGNTTTTLPEKEMIYTGEEKLAFHPQYVYHTSDDHLIFLLLRKDKLNYALGKMKLK